MLQTLGGNAFLVISVLVFVAVLLLLEGVYLFWKSYKGPEAKKIERRLQALSASSDHTKQAQLLKQGMLSDVPVIERFLLGMAKAEGLGRFIFQAGLSWTVSRLLLTCAAVGAISFTLVIYLAHQSLLLGAVVGAVFAAAPLLYVSYQRTRRLDKFEKQLPDALDLITRALRSGHALSSALQMVGDEMAEPVAGEFRVVHDEVNFGVSLQQALTNLSVRVPLTDLRYFIVSVLIQRDSGGNLTEVLGNLSRLIRERLKLLSKVRILSSEGRLSAWILGIMPFALAGLMYLLNPAFMAPLWTDPIGISIIKYMLILMAFGALMLRKIIKIHV
ncbi:pilus assembly protein TadB [Rhodococcus sp. SRB_17]|uniref:type II secretion system F family protein n=1 Tax=Acidovorax sp. SRB_24 TaxID=1962700 RepID=UPI00145D1B08|nr:type II secretion system F family protein [Acidovorax sp. SRB_24]NMM78667.1 pilus assembly protein TadB [Acidovorax sp. SRB_24]NMM84762.1 pilus assembly protein TadB [Rhodococcus sp. SRB_17]